jgi:hypothetical protein
MVVMATTVILVSIIFVVTMIVNAIMVNGLEKKPSNDS